MRLKTLCTSLIKKAQHSNQQQGHEAQTMEKLMKFKNIYYSYYSDTYPYIYDFDTYHYITIMKYIPIFMILKSNQYIPNYKTH